MDTSLFCVYVLLQMVLAPLLYPFGYLLQAVVIILNSWRRQSFSETESVLLEPLLLSLLICSLVLTEGISLSGYAVRIGVLLCRLYFSRPLLDLTQAILDPLTSCFLLAELIASPHLYPMGYLAQLGVIIFLYISGTLQQFSGPLSSKNRKKNWQRYLERSRLSGAAKSSSLEQNTRRALQSDADGVEASELVSLLSHSDEPTLLTSSSSLFSSPFRWMLVTRNFSARSASSTRCRPRS